MVDTWAPGGQVQTLATATPPLIPAFTADATTAFFVNYDGSLSSVPRADGAVTKVTSSHIAQPATDASNVYGISPMTGDAGSAMAIVSVPKTGGALTVLYTAPKDIGEFGSASTKVVDTSAGLVDDFAVDPSGAVYFGSGSCLYKAP